MPRTETSLSQEYLSRIITIAGLIFILSACGNNNSANNQPLTGQLFPPLVLTDFNDQTTSLQYYRDKVTVINIWAPWCGPCLEEMPSLQRLYDFMDSGRFAVIGLTVDDDRYLAEEFLVKHNILFPNYIDSGRQIVENVLGVRKFPQTFIIGRDGVLLKHITGYQVWDSQETIKQLEMFYQI